MLSKVNVRTCASCRASSAARDGGSGVLADPRQVAVEVEPADLPEIEVRFGHTTFCCGQVRTAIPGRPFGRRDTVDYMSHAFRTDGADGAGRPDMVDWDLAVRIGGRLAGEGPTVGRDEAAAIVEELRAGADRSTGLVREFTGLVAARPLGARAGRRPGRLGAGERRRASRRCSRRSSTSSPRRSRRPGITGRDRLAGHRRRGRQRCSASWRRRCSASSTRSTSPTAGCCSSRPTSSTSSASSRPTRTTSGSGSACTRRPTACSSPRCRGCASTCSAQIQKFAETMEPSGLLEDGLSRVLEGLKNARAGGRRAAASSTWSARPEQKELLDGLTGVMSLLEGHADVVMDGVGPTVIPSVAKIRAKFNERRKGVGVLDRLLRRVLGLDAKMAQYRDGAAFVRARRRQGRDVRLQRGLGAARQPAHQGRDRRPRRLDGARAQELARVSLHPSVAAVRVAVRRTLAALVAEQPGRGCRRTPPCWSPAPAAPDSLALLSATVFEGAQARPAGDRRDRRPRPPGRVGRARRARRRADGRARRRRDRHGPGRGRRAAVADRRRRPARRGTPCSTRSRERFGAAAVLLGHTLDDQAETVLLGPGPRLRRPVAGRACAARFDRLPPAAARRDPHRHRDRLPGRGHRVLERPAQHRPALHPGPGPAHGAPGARGRARPRASPAPWPAPPTSSAPTWSSSTQLAAGRRTPSCATPTTGSRSRRSPTCRSRPARRVLRLAALEAGATASELFHVHVLALAAAAVVAWRRRREVQLPGHVTAYPPRAARTVG